MRRPDGSVVLLSLVPGEQRAPDAAAAPSEPWSGPGQRRAAVRGRVRLGVRGAVLPGGPVPPELEASFAGSTEDVGAGGLHMVLEPRGDLVLPTGHRVFVELDLPDGLVVPAVVRLAATSPGELRGCFLDIAPVDVERLVRLVFAKQRRELAARHRSREGRHDGSPGPEQIPSRHLNLLPHRG